MPSQTPARTHLFALAPSERARQTLPKYLFRRGDTLYFKRKIPADVADGFPEVRGQVWKSLGTHLVEKARVPLAVEVTEFDLRVAELRRQRAARRAADRAAQELGTAATPIDAEVSVLPPNLASTMSCTAGPAGAPGRPGPALLSATWPATAFSLTSCLPVRPSMNFPAVTFPLMTFLAAAVPSTCCTPTPTVAALRDASPLDVPESSAVRTRGIAGDGFSSASSAAGPLRLATPAQPRPTPLGQRTQVPAVGKPKPGPAAGPARPSMLHLFEDWKRKQTRHRTVNAVHTAVMEFRTLLGPLAVDELTKTHARAYRDHLIERGLSKGTVENRLGFLATLVRHGMKELVEHLVLNPFERIEVIGATGLRKPKDRRAYEVAELNLLYSSRLYTEGYRPDGQCADVAYWAPLLGPFLGARIEEVCQLRTEDIQRINGTWCVRICDLGEDQQVKTLSSFRRVPLHEAVIKAGFLVYAARMARAGQERLFPTLSKDNANGIFSNALGKFFGRYLETIGLNDHRLDYHSFRYSFRQQCSLCGVENETRDALTGHWLNKSEGGRTYMQAENRQYPFPKLVSAMAQLSYDELRIAHLFVDDPMAGVVGALLT